ncbi:hypothetical protein L9F63_017519, partial [Diploptera punctata]
SKRSSMGLARARQAALLLRQARLIPHPYAKMFCFAKFIDTGGGFLLEQKEGEEEIDKITLVKELGPIIEPDRPTCEECQEIFEESNLFKSFDHPVCDSCR